MTYKYFMKPLSFGNLQKKPSRGVFRKEYSENIQQIYRRTPMPKQFYWNYTSA